MLPNPRAQRASNFRKLFQLNGGVAAVTRATEPPRARLQERPSEKEEHITSSFFKQAGDAILLLGGWGWEMAATSYVREAFKIKSGTPPHLDLAKEKQLQALCRETRLRSGEEGTTGPRRLEARIGPAR